jgi:hypothetical protein
MQATLSPGAAKPKRKLAPDLALPAAAMQDVKGGAKYVYPRGDMTWRTG